MKVYCQQCKYIRQLSGNSVGCPRMGEPPNMVCDAPENMIKDNFDTWYQNVKDVRHQDFPKDINKNNDCRWFNEKE